MNGFAFSMFFFCHCFACFLVAVLFLQSCFYSYGFYDCEMRIRSFGACDSHFLKLNILSQVNVCDPLLNQHESANPTIINSGTISAIALTHS